MSSAEMDEGLSAVQGRETLRMSAEVLRTICIEEGADDVGFVEVGRDALSGERRDILKVYGDTRTLVSVVKAVNPESIHSPSASVADHEFSKIHKDLYDVTGRIIKRLNASGIRHQGCRDTPPAFPWTWTAGPGRYGR